VITQCHPASGIGPQRALEANTKIPRAQRESPYSQSFLSERRTALQKVPQRSGIGPQRALEAINLSLALQRQSFFYPEPPCERRTDAAEPPIRPAEVPPRPRLGMVWGMRRSFRTLRLCAIPGVSPRAGIGVGMAVVGHPSLRTGQAGFPHPALQSVSHPLAAGLVRSARAKAYREISP
jgi:hypothetical protein